MANPNSNIQPSLSGGDGGGGTTPTASSPAHRFEQSAGFDILDSGHRFEELTVNIPQRLLDDRTLYDIGLDIEASSFATSGFGSARLDIRHGTDVLASSGNTVLTAAGSEMSASAVLPMNAMSVVVRVTRVGAFDVQIDRITADVYLGNVTVYPAAVANVTPTAADFTVRAIKRGLLTLTSTHAHAALAYPASLGVRPVFLFDGARYRAPITESAATITVDGEALHFSVTTSTLPEETILFDWEFAESFG